MTKKYYKYEETHRKVNGRKQKYCSKCNMGTQVILSPTLDIVEFDHTFLPESGENITYEYLATAGADPCWISSGWCRKTLVASASAKALARFQSNLQRNR